MAKRTRNPEQEAEWDEQRRELARLIQEREARKRELLERDRYRRQRLKRLSFGLLGRE